MVASGHHGAAQESQQNLTGRRSVAAVIDDRQALRVVQGSEIDGNPCLDQVMVIIDARPIASHRIASHRIASL